MVNKILYINFKFELKFKIESNISDFPNSKSPIETKKILLDKFDKKSLSLSNKTVKKETSPNIINKSVNESEVPPKTANTKPQANFNNHIAEVSDLKFHSKQNPNLNNYQNKNKTTFKLEKPYGKILK